MISVEDAIARVVDAFQPLPAEVVALDAALGRVLACDLTARLDQPPADVSAMDGYAIRADDAAALPAELRVIGQSAAGAHFAGTLGPGDAVRIFTGAAIPDGADTVVIQEKVEAAGCSIVVRHSPRPGTFIRRKALDFSQGDVLLHAGRRLNARDIGLAAAMNHPWLAVRSKPRIAVLATGDELVMPGEPRDAQQIVSSGSFTVVGMLHGFGAAPQFLGIAGDSEASLAFALNAARGADLLITIGGASVGDFDIVRRLLGGEGASAAFEKVAMRPGKPLLFTRFNGLPVLALPGNPVSAGVVLLVVARPAIERMLGITESSDAAASALLGRDLPANDERQDYLRSTLARNQTGELVATPFPIQDSSMMRLFAQARCLVMRPPFAPAARAGKRVAIVPLTDDPSGIV
jgi:molybdopterin molybdotransferase